ncbi:MAG: hypothetical protein AAFR82_11305 [Pseudomonadota bacterium]
MSDKTKLTPRVCAGLASLSLFAMAGCAGTEALAAGAMGDAFASAAGIPQMDAFLPYETQVPATEALPIDGDYTISTLGKRVRIDRGRSYALDPWTHAMTLKIRPNMVVGKDFRQISATEYTSQDLPLLGAATMKVQSDGRIAVSVASIPPYNYTLLPTERTTAPDPGTGIGDPPADTSECQNLDLDPASGALICLD